MFEILFGWRSAPRCKRLIKRVQCRLAILKNKKDSIIRQSRQDVVQLIKNGNKDCAFSRVEQLYKDQSIKTVYDLLYSFCEFIIINLSYIRRHRDCPNDINEAVSSLLYASARCGELPELIKLRDLFSKRYGQNFAMTAVELLHGNLVNRQIIENLLLKSITCDLKLNLMKDIARDNGLELDHQESDLSMGKYIEWTEDKSEEDIQLTYNGIDGSKLQASYEKELHDIAKSYDSTFATALDRVQTSDSNLVFRSSVKIENHEERSSSMACSAPQYDMAETNTGAASESPSRFSERSIVYLDDVEELYPSTKEAVKAKDQRLFMFRSNAAATTKSLSGLYQDKIEPCDRSDGISSSRSSGNRRKSSKKKLKRRYVVVENLSMKDVECALYYGEPEYSSPDDDLISLRSYTQKKHQRKRMDAESLDKKLPSPKSPYFYAWRMPEDIRGKDTGKHNQKICADGNSYHEKIAGCSLEQPCYLITGDDNDNWENTHPKPRSGTKATMGSSHRSLPKEKCGDVQNCRCSYVEAFSSNVKTKSKRSVDATERSTSKDTEEAEVIDCRRSCASSHDSCSRVTSPWTWAKPPYLRAMTMPPERPTEVTSRQIVRSASCLPEEQNRNIGSPSFVHPKLPDYDALAAKFQALKKDQLLGSTSEVGSSFRLKPI